MLIYAAVSLTRTGKIGHRAICLYSQHDRRLAFWNQWAGFSEKRSKPGAILM
jgi:hypothetical protein